MTDKEKNVIVKDLPRYQKLWETEASQDLLWEVGEKAADILLWKWAGEVWKKLAKFWPMLKKMYEEKQRQSLLDEAYGLMDKYWKRDEKWEKIPADWYFWEDSDKFMDKFSDEDDERFFKVLNILADKYDTILW